MTKMTSPTMKTNGESGNIIVIVTAIIVMVVTALSVIGLNSTGSQSQLSNKMADNRQSSQTRIALDTVLSRNLTTVMVRDAEGVTFSFAALDPCALEAGDTPGMFRLTGPGSDQLPAIVPTFFEGSDEVDVAYLDADECLADFGVQNFVSLYQDDLEGDSYLDLPAVIQADTDSQAANVVQAMGATPYDAAALGVQSHSVATLGQLDAGDYVDLPGGSDDGFLDPGNPDVNVRGANGLNTTQNSVGSGLDQQGQQIGSGDTLGGVNVIIGCYEDYELVNGQYNVLDRPNPTVDFSVTSAEKFQFDYMDGVPFSVGSFCSDEVDSHFQAAVSGPLADISNEGRKLSWNESLQVSYQGADCLDDSGRVSPACYQGGFENISEIDPWFQEKLPGVDVINGDTVANACTAGQLLTMVGVEVDGTAGPDFIKFECVTDELGSNEGSVGDLVYSVGTDGLAIVQGTQADSQTVDDVKNFTIRLKSLVAGDNVQLTPGTAGTPQIVVASTVEPGLANVYGLTRGTGIPATANENNADGSIFRRVVNGSVFEFRKLDTPQSFISRAVAGANLVLDIDEDGLVGTEGLNIPDCRDDDSSNSYNKLVYNTGAGFICDTDQEEETVLAEQDPLFTSLINLGMASCSAGEVLTLDEDSNPEMPVFRCVALSSGCTIANVENLTSGNAQPILTSADDCNLQARSLLVNEEFFEAISTTQQVNLDLSADFKNKLTQLTEINGCFQSGMIWDGSTCVDPGSQRVESGQGVAVDVCGGEQLSDLFEVYEGLCSKEWTKQVAFSQPFAVTPHVMVTPADMSVLMPGCVQGKMDKISVRATDITRTGFTIRGGGAPIVNDITEDVNCPMVMDLDLYNTQFAANWIAIEGDQPGGPGGPTTGPREEPRECPVLAIPTFGPYQNGDKSSKPVDPHWANSYNFTTKSRSLYFMHLGGRTRYTGPDRNTKPRDIDYNFDSPLPNDAPGGLFSRSIHIEESPDGNHPFSITALIPTGETHGARAYLNNNLAWPNSSVNEHFSYHRIEVLESDRPNFFQYDIPHDAENGAGFVYDSPIIPDRLSTSKQVNATNVLSVGTQKITISGFEPGKYIVHIQGTTARLADDSVGDSFDVLFLGQTANETQTTNVTTYRMADHADGNMPYHVMDSVIADTGTMDLVVPRNMANIQLITAYRVNNTQETIATTCAVTPENCELDNGVTKKRTSFDPVTDSRALVPTVDLEPGRWIVTLTGYWEIDGCDNNPASCENSVFSAYVQSYIGTHAISYESRGHVATYPDGNSLMTITVFVNNPTNDVLTHQYNLPGASGWLKFIPTEAKAQLWTPLMDVEQDCQGLAALNACPAGYVAGDPECGCSAFPYRAECNACPTGFTFATSWTCGCDAFPAEPICQQCPTGFVDYYDDTCNCDSFAAEHVCSRCPDGFQGVDEPSWGCGCDMFPNQPICQQCPTGFVAYDDPVCNCDAFPDTPECQPERNCPQGISPDATWDGDGNCGCKEFPEEPVCWSEEEVLDDVFPDNWIPDDHPVFDLPSFLDWRDYMLANRHLWWGNAHLGAMLHYRYMMYWARWSDYFGDGDNGGCSEGFAPGPQGTCVRQVDSDTKIDSPTGIGNGPR